MHTYPGLPPDVELIPDVKTSLVNKARICPIDRQYVCCNWVCKKLCNNNPKRGRGWPIFKKKEWTVWFNRDYSSGHLDMPANTRPLSQSQQNWYLLTWSKVELLLKKNGREPKIKNSANTNKQKKLQIISPEKNCKDTSPLLVRVWKGRSNKATADL